MEKDMCRGQRGVPTQCGLHFGGEPPEVEHRFVVAIRDDKRSFREVELASNVFGAARLGVLTLMLNPL